MPAFFDHWLYLTAASVAVVALAVLAAAHALLNKRQPRSAVLWVGLILAIPLVGSLLYLILGVNRIRRRAQKARSHVVRYGDNSESSETDDWRGRTQAWPSERKHLGELCRVVDRLTSRALAPGNAIEPLVNGEEAYPAMLEAIDQACQSISLVTYLFGNDEVGQSFVTGLARARERGVEVRVLIDDFGVRYHQPTIISRLKKNKIPYATFLPILRPTQLTFFNLRNHRKILVVDGCVGFTGGMNIGVRHLVEKAGTGATLDMHFRVRGPVVRHLQDSFAEDWGFATEELLRGEGWFPELEDVGQVFARGITDGPDEDVDNLPWTLLAALAAARERVRIVTPYFLPSEPLISAMNMAAMRGVEVDIVLPEKSNLRFVDWATQAMLWQVLSHDCKVWLTPAPFDHSKLMVVDGSWTLLGSTNWDPRALRLNFEFNLECYDDELAAKVERLIEQKMAPARRTSLSEVDSRSLPIRLRDGAVRLLTPYL